MFTASMSQLSPPLQKITTQNPKQNKRTNKKQEISPLSYNSVYRKLMLPVEGGVAGIDINLHYHYHRCLGNNLLEKNCLATQEFDSLQFFYFVSYVLVCVCVCVDSEEPLQSVTFFPFEKVLE